jgi:hypothetical protein
MQTFMSLSVVLSSKGLATDCADEWSLVSVSAQMGSQIVGARESFGTQSTLERCRMLLHAFTCTSILAILIFRIC